MNWAKFIILLNILFYSCLGFSEEDQLRIKSDYCFCSYRLAFIEKDSCVEFCKKNDNFHDQLYGTVALPSQFRTDPQTSNLHDICTLKDQAGEFINKCLFKVQFDDGDIVHPLVVKTFENTNSFKIQTSDSYDNPTRINSVIMGKLHIETKTQEYVSPPIFFSVIPYWNAYGLSCIGEGTKFHNSQNGDGNIPPENIAEFSLINLDHILYRPEGQTIFKDISPIKRILLGRKDETFKFSSSNQTYSITVFCEKNAIYLERKDFPETGVWYQKVKNPNTPGILKN